MYKNSLSWFTWIIPEKAVGEETVEIVLQVSVLHQLHLLDGLSVQACIHSLFQSRKFHVQLCWTVNVCSPGKCFHEPLSWHFLYVAHLFFWFFFFKKKPTKTQKSKAVFQEECIENRPRVHTACVLRCGIRQSCSRAHFHKECRDHPAQKQLCCKNP